MIGLGYWTERAKYLAKLRNAREFKTDKAIAEAYKKTAIALKEKLESLLYEINEAKFYGNITPAEAIDFGTLTVNDLYTYNKYYDLINEINQKLMELAKEEETIMLNDFEELYIENVKEIGKDFEQSEVDMNAMQACVNEVWCNDGKVWSQRVWDNQQQLADMLRDGITQCMTTGVSPKKLARMISDSMQVGLGQSQRLVRTEMTHIQNQSAVDRYNQAGVSKFKVLEFGNCCEVCKKQNGKIYLMSEQVVGKTCPPFHPNCRGTVIPIIEE